MKQKKVIFTVDPGVDDAEAILIASQDKKISIELLAVADGNISQQTSINNTLFLLDLLDKDYLTVAGKKIKKRTDEEGRAAQKRAEEMHGHHSLGGVKTPNKFVHKTTEVDIADKMYEIISANPHKVSILACTPLTDVAYLFEKYSESITLVKQVIFVGGSFGLPGQPDHISYNAGTNAKALDEVIKSGVKLIIIPSLIGRTFANFSDVQVEEISKINDCGKFLAQMFDTYWEIGFADKFVSNNDVCSYLYLAHKRIFKTKKYDVTVDLIDRIGKLTRTPNVKSNVRVVDLVNRKAFLKIMHKNIKHIKNFKYSLD